MKIAALNMTHSGSTGRIMLQIAQCAAAAGHEVKTFSPKAFSFREMPVHPQIPGHTYYGSTLSRGIHTVLGVAAGWNGLLSVAATRELLRELDAFGPDLIHLHNLHQFCIHFPMLLRYIKKKKIRTIWTLHDCWTFTGHCPHFDYIGCEKWKTGCHDCPQLAGYPKSYVDHSKWMYRHKKAWFSGVADMTLVTPSRWLAEQVQESFLKEYPVQVIHNGIDLERFRPDPGSFREKHGCVEKKLILGVAFDWSHRKGLDVFAELASRLDDAYQIVLVGTDETVEAQLPGNILSIRRTESQAELAQIYSAADVFVNPTREEVLGLVNVEALACGTPVITFRSGGSPECVDETCGVVVDRDDIGGMLEQILRVCADRPFGKEACRARAMAFCKDQKYKEYIKLYERD